MSFALAWLAGLAIATATRGDEEREAWQAAAARCGSDLAWAADWETAAKRAQAERKPVLAVAWMYDGFDVIDGSRTSFAMDPDVIALVNARFVPLSLHKDTPVPFSAHDRYGLSPTSLGAALLVVAPDGHVLADAAMYGAPVDCEFLRAFLVAHAEFPGADEPAGLTPEARAERQLERGELDAAGRTAAKLDSQRAHLVRARLARQRRDLDGALAELRAQPTADAELAGEMEIEELLLLVALGRNDEARKLGERMLEPRAQVEASTTARFVLGLLDEVDGHADAARTRWSALVAEKPESRSAWLAAVSLLATPVELELELGLRLTSPSPALLDLVRVVPFERADEDAARAGAVRWLRALQTAAGDFPDASDLEGNPRYRNDVSLAVDALAARALLAAGERAAAERATAALFAERAASAPWKGREFMTYGSWADSLGLELVVELLAAGVGDAKALRKHGTELAEDLVGRQRENGGWSYFYATSLEEDAPVIEQSLSFVTATAVRALQHARAAEIELDEDALDQGLDCLEAMRDEDGVFTYMLLSVQERTDKELQVTEAAGRGPLCELALLEAGRSDAARLRTALERFLAHLPLLAAERGKALMHCGEEGQGCHYVLYDYATAAQAIARLPAEERAPFRARLMESLLDCRRADGAFLDAPVLGPTPGTALALLALVTLGR